MTAEAGGSARRLEANGLRFHVVDEGAGPAVLLLHGFPDTANLWRHQIPALLGAGYRAIAPDQRGRGRSDMPERVADYALPAIVADAVAILDKLGVAKAHVVGHDWGAAVGWVLAALAPERVDRLVALSVGYPGAAGKPTLEALQKGWYRLLFQLEGVAEKLLQQDDWYLFRELFHGCGDVDDYVASMSEPGRLTAALNWYRANLPVERLLGPSRPLPPVRSPTLGVWSTGDLYLTEEAMTRSAEKVAGPWRYERIDGASHWIPLDEPAELNKLLLEFLAA